MKLTPLAAGLLLLASVATVLALTGEPQAARAQGTLAAATRTPTATRTPSPTRTPTATRTPTPTRTPTATRTRTPTRTRTATRTASPTATSTPSPVVPAALLELPLPSRFFGTVTWFGAPLPAESVIEAVIGGTVCGVGTLDGEIYTMNVASGLYRPGCGSTDAIVRFRIDGLEANEPALFVPGAASPLMLTGPRMEDVAVTEGCAVFESAYPDGTTPSFVAQGFSPSTALESLWVWDDVAGDWLAYLPGIEEASSLTRIDQGDELYVCATGDAVFQQPAR